MSYRLSSLRCNARKKLPFERLARAKGLNLGKPAPGHLRTRAVVIQVTTAIAFTTRLCNYRVQTNALDTPLRDFQNLFYSNWNVIHCKLPIPSTLNLQCFYNMLRLFQQTVSWLRTAVRCDECWDHIENQQARSYCEQWVNNPKLQIRCL